MKTVLVFFIALVLCAISQAETYEDFLSNEYVNNTARGVASELRSGGLPRLARFIDQDLDTIVALAVQKFRDANPDNELTAEEFEWEYAHRVRGVATRELYRSIGDHDPALPFLISLFKKSVELIGLEATEALHISDLAVISWSIPVTFHVKTFSPNLVHPNEPRIQDYRDHFAKDSGNDHLYGLASVATYWAIDIGCMVGTSGIAALLCGPAAMAGEYIMGTRLGPRLSDFVYTRAGGE